MNFCPKPKLQGFENKKKFMFKYFQVAMQKVKKSLNFEMYRTFSNALKF